MSELQRYDYHLPPELIAQEPLENRSDARLMLVDRARQTLEHYRVCDLPGILRRDDCLVSNDTRVVPARLIGYRTATQGRWEGLFLEASHDGFWRLLCKTRGRLKPGESVTLLDRKARPAATLEMLAKHDDGIWVAKPHELPLDPAEANHRPPPLAPQIAPTQALQQPLAHAVSVQLLERIGRVPLPHYIRGGEMIDSDRLHYQTVFAREPGAVAAPTAGLHFTHELLIELIGLRIKQCRVTLHVVMDTFRPISVDSLADHPMHAEWGRIEASAVETIATCKSRGGRTVAVGTTSVRVLETAAGQPGGLLPWSGQTRLFIRPPYQFRAVDALLTNFHLPHTTLLVLVRTFGGEELLKAAYAAAIREKYRFYSYGDAMLIV